MKKVFFILIVTTIDLLLHGLFSGQVYAHEFDPSLLRKVELFRGTVRRDLQGDEVFSVLEIKNLNPGQSGLSCSAFRAAQVEGKFFVVTARHCFDYQEEEACNRNIIKVLPVKASQLEFVGTCKRIIVSSAQDDLFIFEMNVHTKKSAKMTAQKMRSDVFNKIIGFKLASYKPAVGSPLLMLGFPGDQIRWGAPTAVDRCEVLTDDAEDSLEALPEGVKTEIIQKFSMLQAKMQDPQFSGDQDVILQKARDQLDLIFLKHNCSVYGGNSGGLVQLPNTRDAVGLPHDYYQEYFEPIPRTYSRQIESTRGFTQRFRPVLEANKIEISDEQPKHSLPNYLKKNTI